MPDTINLPADGFTLNPAIRLWPYNYVAGALAQMDTLRRAATYRPRIYAVPDDYNQPLDGYETLEYQIKLASGSYIWGMMFRQYSAGWAQQDPTSVVIQLSEACTGVPFYSEFSQAQGLAFYTASPLASGIAMPHILTQPRIILEPGDVNVELCNLSSASQRCQLLIFTAEPCETIIEG
jgi:hypothetical protein